MLVLFACAQNGTSANAETIDRIRQIFNAQELYKLEFSGPKAQLLFHEVKDLRDTTLTTRFDYAGYYAAQAAYAKKQLGLTLRADALQNSQSLFTDLEDNILYQRRYLIGLEWDILKNGFLQRNTQLKSIELQEEVTNIEQKNTVPLKSSVPRTACIAYFNAKKIQLLEARQKTLKSYLPYLEQLFYAKQITLEDLFASQSRLVETHEQLDLYKNYNKQLQLDYIENLFDLSAPVFDINDSIFFGSLRNAVAIDTAKIRSLQQEIAQTENKWYNELTLRAYTRMNVYDLYSPMNPYRSFFSLGVNFSMPLMPSHREKAQMDLLKWEKDHQRVMQSSNERLLEQANSCYEYRFGLNKLLMLQEKEKQIREAIRIERAKNQLKESDFHPMHGLKLIDDLAQIQLEEIGMRQVLYLKLIDLHEKNNPTIADTWLTQLDPLRSDAFPENNRTVYAWSKVFINEPGVLAAFTEYNRFKKVLLAVGESDSLISRKDEFVRLVATADIEVAPLIGSNKLLFATDYSKELEEILKAYAHWNFKEIHLDIEPHTQENWKEDEAKAFANYMEKLKETKTICTKNGWLLSIAIPISYDSAQVKACLEIADEIHFMCYENIKATYLSRKLAPYQQYGNRIHIALRTEDFQDRYSLEQFINHLSTNDGFVEFDYHDLSRLIQWDLDQLQHEKR